VTACTTVATQGFERSPSKLDDKYFHQSLKRTFYVEAIDKILVQMVTLTGVDQALEQMKTAVREVRNLDDDKKKQMESYALGNLGGLYEYLAQSDKKYIKEAQRLTEQALYIAQPTEIPDLAYQWQWQLGRLSQLENNQQKTIEAYQAAVRTLKFARKNLLAVNSDFQFSFRDNIEPLYRELTTLLLQLPDQNSLNQAIETTDDLQLTELENFLRCDLSKSKKIDTEIDNLDKNVVFIYPIVLKDGLEIVYKTPGASFKHISTGKDQKISHEQVEKTVKDLQIALVHPSQEDKVKKYGSMLYTWLIQPIKSEIGNVLTPDKTLVFVLDGDLKNIPMSVLYSGKHYLIEEYALSIVPSRSLFESRPRQKRLDVLLAGISKAQINIDGKKYKELKFVEKELKDIQSVIKSSHQPILDDKFTKEEFEKQISKFPIIHIATHGAFSSDPNETYILAWGERIRGKEIEKVTQVSNFTSESRGINLLILSACETAQGNRRATLGLAGIAAKSRVRSTIATLWQVNDPSTALFMKNFYQELQNNHDISLAKALQSVQVKLIQDGYASPHYWAPFILVGNWL
jgi:CHAT domain-containing protein